MTGAIFLPIFCGGRFGSSMGFKSIAEEVVDPDLLALIQNLGYGEDLPVVKDPKIINPQNFIDQLLKKRLPNKNIPDTPQRIASDTSQKIPVRYGVTIHHYLANPKFTVKELQFIPLVIAGWCRYLTGVDDDLQTFEPSPDPLLAELQPLVAPVKFDGSVKKDQAHDLLKPILSNHEIFPDDLYEAGLADKIEQDFVAMLTGKGAIRSTIQQVVKIYGKNW